MDRSLGGRLIAAALALIAAFVWAAYYPLVLELRGGTPPSAVLFYPFAFGGVAFALMSAGSGAGAPLVRQFVAPGAYLRTALLLLMQLTVLAATYLTGPVDASLLSLLGDVVGTPLVVAALFASHRRELGSPAFVVGLILSLAGGSLAIAGGRALGAVHDAAWLTVVGVPASVALYFVLSARAAVAAPADAVVGQSMLAAAVGCLVLAPLLPGGLPAILRVGAVPLGLLAATGVTSFFLAPVLYFRAIGRAGLLLPPMLMTGIPVFTLFLSAAFLGISPPPLGLLGVPVAVGGGILALAAGTRRARVERPAGPVTPSR